MEKLFEALLGIVEAAFEIIGGYREMRPRLRRFVERLRARLAKRRRRSRR